MKIAASNTTYSVISQLAQRLNLGRILEGTYGAGVMGNDSQKTQKAGWTTEQLLAMSAAKSFYN